MIVNCPKSLIKAIIFYRLTNLTRLALGITERLDTLEPPSSIRELRLTGSTDQLQHLIMTPLTPSLIALPLLTRLELGYSPLGPPFVGKVRRGTPKPLFGHLRYHSYLTC